MAGSLTPATDNSPPYSHDSDDEDFLENGTQLLLHLPEVTGEASDTDDDLSFLENGEQLLLHLEAHPGIKAAQSFLDSVLGDVNSNDHARLHPGRPHVTLTYAQSLDGKIAGKGSTQLPLSGDESWIMTHWMRSMHDGIMVGIGTVINDNPGLAPTKLPPRDEPYPAPSPIILDTNLRIPITSKVIGRHQSGEGKRPIILCKPGADPEKKAHLEAIGVAVIEVKVHPTRGHLILKDALAKLSQHGIRSVMVEGGAQVISRLLEIRSYVDFVIITVSPMWVGADGLDAMTMTEGHALPKLQHVKSVVMGKDTVVACRLAATSS